MARNWCRKPWGSMYHQHSLRTCFRGLQTDRRVALGLDFGTEEARAVLVATDGSGVVALGKSRYEHGQITQTNSETVGLPVLPRKYALQHPQDWINAASSAVTQALDIAGGKEIAQRVVGIGVDFTSCTMVPCVGKDATPLCLAEHRRSAQASADQWSTRPHAWPKLWKHHGAATQAERLTQIAHAGDGNDCRRVRTLLNAKYGGVVGLEWMFPKALEVFEEDAEVFAAMETWVEAGDWMTWQLTGASAHTALRSTCAAGYKGLWSSTEGYPPAEYLEKVHTGFASVLQRLGPGDAASFRSPGQSVGGLRPGAELDRVGLGGLRDIPAGTPISAACIDAHAGVPGVGVSRPNTMVLVLGTSACYMINTSEEKEIPGVCGMVPGGILPGLVGYETGQAAVGDLFAWVASITGRSLDDLEAAAQANVPPGAEGLELVDHFHGCRTPLMDGSLTGHASGLTLSTTPAHLYRAVAESAAMGCRRVLQLLEEHAVPVHDLVATGGLAHKPFFRQILADVLGRTIHIHPATDGPAIGAAVYGAAAAEVFPGGMSEAVDTMVNTAASKRASDAVVVEPNASLQPLYASMYSRYLFEIESQARKKRLHSVGPKASAEASSREGAENIAYHTPSTASTESTQPAVYIDGKLTVRVGTRPCPPDVLSAGQTDPDAEIVLDVVTVGVCGSDMHYYKDGGIGSDAITKPFVPGHEFAGRLRADDAVLGKAGTLVAVDPGVVCNACEWCRDGQQHLCAGMRFIGAPPHDGALTPRLAVPRSNIYSVPPTMTAEQVTMIEPLGIALHASRLAAIQPGEDVVVLGAGPIGLLLVQLLLRNMPRRVYAIDPIAVRRDKALELGAAAVAADYTAIADWTEHRGCDVVVEATDATAGMKHAILSARRGGRVVLVGIPQENTYEAIAADTLRRRALTLTMSRRMNHVMEDAIELIASGTIDTSSLITHRFVLKDTARAFETLANPNGGAIKAVIQV
eukprot:m.61021 g.61021  ORF g.61021 m.61021 type:complete len:977 (+) comp15746_c0_seq1:373-3303(+)